MSLPDLAHKNLLSVPMHPLSPFTNLMQVSIVTSEVLKLVEPNNGKKLVIQTPFVRQSLTEQECLFWIFWKQELNLYSVKSLRLWDLSVLLASFTLTNKLMYLCSVYYFCIICPIFNIYIYMSNFTHSLKYNFFNYSFPNSSNSLCSSSEMLSCCIYIPLRHILCSTCTTGIFLNLKTLECIQLLDMNFGLLISVCPTALYIQPYTKQSHKTFYQKKICASILTMFQTSNTSSFIFLGRNFDILFVLFLVFLFFLLPLLLIFPCRSLNCVQFHLLSLEGP